MPREFKSAKCNKRSDATTRAGIVQPLCLRDLRASRARDPQPVRVRPVSHPVALSAQFGVRAVRLEHATRKLHRGTKVEAILSRHGRLGRAHIPVALCLFGTGRSGLYVSFSHILEVLTGCAYIGVHSHLILIYRA